MSLLNGILCGLCGMPDDTNQFSNNTGERKLSDDELAAQIVDKLYTAEKSGNALKGELQGMIQANGWRENLAEAIVGALEAALREGRAMSVPFKEAHDKAWEEARKVEGWMDDHPVIATVIYTIIALGIATVMIPWLLEMLGFAEIGIIEGKIWLGANNRSLVTYIV
jgi:hypothetical protein